MTLVDPSGLGRINRREFDITLALVAEMQNRQRSGVRGELSVEDLIKKYGGCESSRVCLTVFQ
jgi:hypothetical protein